MLEDVAVYNVEVDIPMSPVTTCFGVRIGPGQMLNWQLDAPHRVENLDAFSVSMTVSDTNDQIRRYESSISPTACYEIVLAISRKAVACVVRPT